MIRVAAVADVHYDHSPRRRMREHFGLLKDTADLFLLGGDLTQSGALEEVEALVSDLEYVSIPVVAVLGNHDFHQNKQADIMKCLSDAGVFVLEGSSVTLRVRGQEIGIMGLKGFGGGFFGACVTEFGEPETKEFAVHGRNQAEILKAGLKNLNTDYKFVLLHFSPVEGTLLGEKREIFPFLGNYLLAEAIDAGGVDAAFHGHAHLGVEHSKTPGGVPVRNVAQMVIRHSYKIYTFE